MKKLFLTITFIALLLSCFSLSVFSEGETELGITTEAVETAPIEEPAAAPAEDADPPVVAETPDAGADTHTEPPTLLSRIEEAWEEGSIEKLVFIAAEIALTILVLISRASTNANYKALKLETGKNKLATDEKTNELIDATNSAKIASESAEKNVGAIIELFNDQKKIDTEKSIAIEKKVDDCLLAVSEFAKMLQTAYSGSKMPQPVKDMINTSYVKIEKIVTRTEEKKDESEK